MRANSRFATWTVTIATGALLVCVPAAAGARQAGNPPKTPPQEQAQARKSAEELERIREAVRSTPAIRIREGQVQFYLQVVAPRMTFEDYAKNRDLTSGPVPRAGMTHGEFLSMVTPRELYGGGGIRPGEALQMAVTGLVGQMLVKKAFKSATDYWRARELREINERIDAELASLRGRGGR
jgi:hypothetical protein